MRIDKWNYVSILIKYIVWDEATDIFNSVSIEEFEKMFWFEYVKIEKKFVNCTSLLRLINLSDISITSRANRFNM